MIPELRTFLAQWNEDDNAVKPLFEALYTCLRGFDGVSLEYKGRPGVSHSLRTRHAAQKNRPLFVLVDVIDDDPSSRWLSVCFYADLISDPEGRGDVVPAGLMGEDACCFDVDSVDPDITGYMLIRLNEAYGNAAKG